MITFKIQGDKYQIPTAWSDVTYSQYIQLLSLQPTIANRINLFTQIGLDKILKAKLKNLESISLALSFLDVPFEAKLGATNVGKYPVPKDVTLESVGQFEDLRALCNRRPPDLSTTANQTLFADLCLEACAIYIQKVKDKEYDSEKVQWVKEELKKESCIQVIQTGSFFLFKPLHLQMTTRQRFQKALQRLKKSLVDLPGYQKSLDFLQRSTGSPER